MQSEKNWTLPEIDRGQVESLARTLGVSGSVATVYINRGLDTPAKVTSFCDLNINDLDDPYSLPDMDLAVDRLVRSVRTGELVLVHGDGDCDGITSATLVTCALQSEGGNVMTHVPSRLSDGFGLQPSAVVRAHQLGVTLVVCCDCGTEAVDASETAKGLGVDLIILDHHLPRNGGLPISVACVNPKLSSSCPTDLSGAGVAFLTMLAMTQNLSGDVEDAREHLLEFATLGTCADVVSMQDANRVIVHHGCEKMMHSSWSGIDALVGASGVRQVDTESIGFYIAPMINAACRLGHPEIALGLLLELSPVKARAMACHLKLNNTERKQLQEELLRLVIEELQDDPDTHPIVFASGQDWHRGLIGLAASNLTQRYGKPGFVCSVTDEIATGSCRSVGGINVVEALDASSDILSAYGGHPQAAGFRLPATNLASLKARLSEYVAAHADGIEDSSSTLDAELPVAQINMNTWRLIRQLGPFGRDNEEPKFLTRDTVVATSAVFGGDNRHLRLRLCDPQRSKYIDAIGWDQGSRIGSCPRGTVVDLVHNLKRDVYRGVEKLVLNILDVP